MSDTVIASRGSQRQRGQQRITWPRVVSDYLPRRRRHAGSLALVMGFAAILGSLVLLLVTTPNGETKAKRNAGATDHTAGGGAEGRLGPDDVDSASGVPAVVVLGSPSDGMAVPRSFLGISTEYWALPLFERHGELFARVLSLLKVRGGGGLVLRVGGTSADVTFWDPPGHPMPKWAFGVTPSWLRNTAALLTRTEGQAILDLNLLTDTPRAAGRLASAVTRGLPRGSVAGFEVGNEPDLYSHADWQSTTSGRGFGNPAPPNEISPVSYAKAFDSYSRILAGVAPRVPLVGPAAAYPGSDPNWISTLLTARHPRLGTVSAHLYPYSACADSRSSRYPTIARLLSDNATNGLARTIAPTVGRAHRAGLPVRITELNSVTCGGLSGISDTFATALWAPDALFELLRAGVDGINVHVRETAINGAFALRNRGLIARPLLYGMILFARTLGPDARLVPARVWTSSPLNVKVWAVRVAGGAWHVLLVNKTNHLANVQLRVPASARAAVQRLLAPSADSRSDVTLDGQTLGSDARWHGRPSTETIPAERNGYELTVPARSAALVSVNPPSGDSAT